VRFARPRPAPPALRIVSSREPVEELRDEIRRHAGAAILDGKAERATAVFAAHENGWLAVAQRVTDQVANDALERNPVGHDRLTRVDVDGDVGKAPGASWAATFHRISRMNALNADRHPSRVEAEGRKAKSARCNGGTADRRVTSTAAINGKHRTHLWMRQSVQLDFSAWRAPRRPRFSAPSHKVAKRYETALGVKELHPELDHLGLR